MHNEYLSRAGGDLNRALTPGRQRQLADLLYPQHDEKFADWRDYDKVLSRDEASWLREQAYKHLQGDPSGMADAVRHRMMEIVGGYFPLGFIGWWEVADPI